MEKSKIIEKMPEGLSENEQIRYIYLELGKNFKRDVNFFYANNDRTKKKIYNARKRANEEEIICSTLCKEYRNMYKELGIKSNIVTKQTNGDNPYPHRDLIIIGEKGKKYYANPLNDLFRIQSGMRTKNFASKTNKYKDLDSMDDEELQRIDDKLGYTYHGMYTDEVYEMVKSEFQNRSILKNHILAERPDLTNKDLTKGFLLEYKMDFIFDYLNNTKDLRGYLEYAKHNDSLFNIVLNRSERKKIKRNNIYDTKNEDNLEIMSALRVDVGEHNYVYYVANQNTKYKKMSSEDLLQYMQDNSLGFLKERKDRPEEER